MTADHIGPGFHRGCHCSNCERGRDYAVVAQGCKEPDPECGCDVCDEAWADYDQEG